MSNGRTRRRSLSRGGRGGVVRRLVGWLVGFSAVVALVGPGAIVALSRSAAAAAGGISTIAGTGGVGENGDGIPAVSATMDEPQGVAVDTHGNVLFADTNNNRVRVVAVSPSNPGYPIVGCASLCVWTVGDVYIIAGDGTGYNGDRIPAASAWLDAPTAVAVDKVGDVLISDTGNDRVRVVAVSPSNPGYPIGTWTVGDIYTVAGNGPGSLRYTGDGVLATVAQLSDPRGLTVDSRGNVVIADSGNARVRVVAVATNPGYLLAGCGGSCTWIPGNIYTIAGYGTNAYNGDGIAATGAALDPTAVAVDAHDNLVTTDHDNNRVRVVAVSASNPGYPVTSWKVGDMYTIAGNGTGSYVNDGLPATTTSINQPGGVALDRHNDPLITDTGSNRVRVIAVSASNPGYLLSGCTATCHWIVGDIYTVAGNGTGGYIGDGIPSTSAQLDLPAGIAIDNHGDFYIADTHNSRIREVQIGAAETVPCAPRSVSAAPGKNRAVVHWRTPSCTGGTAVTAYVVTPYLKSTALPARMLKSPATTRTITGLTAKKTYRFKVAARNAAGLGPSSTFSNAITIK
jgi:trimeric autotransporter adhesin